VGRTLTPTDLQALASAVADVARAAGFGLATAWIPEQRISNGILTVKIDEGDIDAIQIEGNGDVVRPALAALIGRGPVRTVELERQLLLAGDIAGIRIGKVRLERRGGTSILIVQARQEKVQARVAIDNWGSDTVGPVRARLTVDLNGLLSSDDQLTVGGVVTPLQPKEFVLGRVHYTKPIGSAGTELGVGGYLARSEPGGALRGRDITGRSAEGEISIRHPFVRSRSGSLWGGFDFKLRDASQSRDGREVRDDRLAIAGANIFGSRQLTGGRLRGRLSLSQGLDVFDATRLGDPMASRADASGVFTKAEGWGEWEQEVGQRLSFALAAEGQIADGPLLSSEEMGLGGRSFGRAWDYREFSGDRGIAGSAELRFDLAKMPKPLSWAQVYTYADAGTVSNYRNGSGGGSLASAGAGIRLWFGSKLDLGTGVGGAADRRVERQCGPRSPHLLFSERALLRRRGRRAASFVQSPDDGQAGLCQPSGFH
jgi:hemolysin activation/secretion protein